MPRKTLLPGSGLFLGPEKMLLLEFIKKYKDTPCLWDRRRRDYTSRQERTKGYKELLEIFKKIDPNATIDLLKAKVDGIRSAFRREVRKARVLEAKGEVYKSSLWYYDHMLWLKNFTETWQVESGCPDTKRQEDDIKAEHPRKAKTRKRECEDSESSQAEILCYTVPECDVDTVSEVESAKVPPISAPGKSLVFKEMKFRPATKTVGAVSRNVEERLSQLDYADCPSSELICPVIGQSQFVRPAPRIDTQQVCDTNKADDQYDVYAKYIASQLRELPPRRFIHLQGQINNLITNERLVCLDGDYSNQQYS